MGSGNGAVTTGMRVVAAAILKDRRCLVALRGPRMRLGGQWELPGGKVELGESDEAALIREIREELGVEIRVDGCLGESRHGSVLLVAYRCALVVGEPNPTEHAELRWLDADHLEEVPWATADVPLLDAVRTALRAPWSADESERYSRHALLDEVGFEGQERLRAASVLCIGAGGLGSPVLMYLAAAGIGRLGIIDFDRVELSNLQRQVIHATSDVGRPKVDSAADRIRAINSNVRVEVFSEALRVDNALAILGGFDVIVDGTDNFATRYLVNDACALLGKPLVYGSIFKFEGQASVFHYRGGPDYRDLYPEPPPPGAIPACGEAGVFGVLPGLIGMIQATEAIKIVLGLGETLSGRLLLYDARALRFQELALHRDPERAPVTHLQTVEAYCGGSMSGENVQTISAAEVARRRDEGWNPYVLDVRKPAEAAISQIEFTDRLHPHETVGVIATELPRDRDLLVYCKRGGRGAEACRTLVSLGFDRVYHLEGGIDAWADAVDANRTRVGRSR